MSREMGLFRISIDMGLMSKALDTFGFKVISIKLRRVLKELVKKIKDKKLGKTILNELDDLDVDMSIA